MERKWAAKETKLPIEDFTTHTYRELFDLELGRKAPTALAFRLPGGALDCLLDVFSTSVSC